MKRTSKLIVALLCLALVLTSSLLVVAACGDKGYTVTASYNRDQGAVSLSAPANGEKYAENENVTVTVTPNSGFEVSGVKVGGTEVQLTDNVYKFAVTADTTVEVTFAEVHNYTVTVNATPAAGGTVTPASGTSYREGTQVTIAVTPAAKYAVKSVKVGGSAVQLADGKYSFAISANTTVDVEFEQVQFDVTATATPAEGGTVDVSPPADTKYAKDESVTVTVTPEKGYKVASFKVNGEDKALTEGAYTFAVAADTAIEVTFERYFNIEVTVDPANSGTYTLADPANGSYYVAGESVKLTVAAASGYELGRVAVDGDDIEAEADGSYLIKVVDDDVVVEIYFETHASRLLNGLKGALNIEGTWTPESAQAATDTYRSVYTDGMFLFEHYKNNLPAFVILGKKSNDDDLDVLGHNVDGTVRPFTYTGEKYSNWANPFADGSAVALADSDLVQGQNGQWTVSGEKAGKLLSVLTHVAGAADVQSVTLTETDNAITAISATLDGGTLSLTISQHGTAAIPTGWASNYAADANADLKAALQASAGAAGYTINVKGAGTDYSVIVTDQAVYQQGGSNNYFKRADGSAWNYTIEGVAFTKGAQYRSSYSALLPSFALENANGAFYNMFENKGNGVYELRSIDLVGFADVGTEQAPKISMVDFGMARALSSYFLLDGSAYSSYLYGSGNRARTLRLTIANGKLAKLEAIAAVSGSNVNIELTFDWDAATLPFTIPSADVNGTQSIDPRLVGTWTDEAGTYELFFSLDEVPTVNGNAATVTAGSEDGSYTLSWQDRGASLSGTLTFDEDGKPVLTVQREGGKSSVYNFERCNWREFFGTYYSRYINSNTMLQVTNKGVAYIYNGRTFAASNVTYTQHALSFYLADVDFQCSLAIDPTEKDYTKYVISIDGEDEPLDEMVLGDSDIFNYYGEYQGKETNGTAWTLTISAAGISATKDGEPVEVAYAATVDLGLEVLRMCVDDVVWAVSLEKNSFLDVNYSGTSAIEEFILIKKNDTPVKFDESWVGSFTDKNRQYTLTITESEVTLAVKGGPAVNAAIAYFQQGGGELYIVVEGLLYEVDNYDGSLLLIDAQEYETYLYKEGKFDIAYQGMWATDHNEFNIVVGPDSIIVNNKNKDSYPVTDATELEDGGYKFTYVDTDTISLTIVVEDDVMHLTQLDEDGQPVPDGKFTLDLYYVSDTDFLDVTGIYHSANAVGIDDDRYVLDIKVNGDVTLYDYTGKEPVVTKATNVHFFFNEEREVMGLSLYFGTTYHEFQIELETYERMLIYTRGSQAYLKCYLVSYEAEPLDDFTSIAGTYSGTYNKRNCSVTITAEGAITVSKDNREAQSATGISAYTVLNNFYYTYEVRMTFTAGDVPYSVKVSPSATYITLNGIVLYKDGTAPDWSAAYGTYENSAGYSLTISEQGIVLVVEYSVHQTAILSYDEQEGFVVVDAFGTLYYIVPYKEDLSRWYVTDAENFEALLGRVFDFDWSQWAGKWTGTSDTDQAYVVNITANGITITIDDVPTKLGNFVQAGDGKIEFTINGDDATLKKTDEKLVLTRGNFTIELTRSGDADEPVAKAEDFVGDWISEYGEFEFVIEKTADSWSVERNGTALTEVSFDEATGKLTAKNVGNATITISAVLDADGNVVNLQLDQQEPITLYKTPSWANALGSYSGYVIRGNYVYTHGLFVTPEGISIVGSIFNVVNAPVKAAGFNSNRTAFIVMFSFGGTNYQLQTVVAQSTATINWCRWLLFDLTTPSGELVCEFYYDLTSSAASLLSQISGTYYGALSGSNPVTMNPVTIQISQDGISYTFGTGSAQKSIIWGTVIQGQSIAGLNIVFNYEDATILFAQNGLVLVYGSSQFLFTKFEGTSWTGTLQEQSGATSDLSGKSCSITFGADNTVTVKVGDGEEQVTISGTYSYNAQTGSIVIQFTADGEITSISIQIMPQYLMLIVQTGAEDASVIYLAQLSQSAAE